MSLVKPTRSPHTLLVCGSHLCVVPLLHCASAPNSLLQLASNRPPPANHTDPQSSLPLRQGFCLTPRRSTRLVSPDGGPHSIRQLAGQSYSLLIDHVVSSSHFKHAAMHIFKESVAAPYPWIASCKVVSSRDNFAYSRGWAEHSIEGGLFKALDDG